MNLAIEQVLAAARALEGVAEEPKNSNAGQMVERFLRLVGLSKGNPWCAAFVSFVGHHGLYDPQTKKSAWPLPLTGGCTVLGEYALKHKVLDTTPERGDVFLLWHTVDGVQRFAHTGFVVAVLEDGSCLTLEGNTNSDGSREGWLSTYKTRHFGANDRFVRWSTLVAA
jgi:hypothetical protein